MKLRIHSRPFELTEALEAHIRRRLKTAFSRVVAPTNGVSITLLDINGPRGGEDKQCKLQFSLPDVGLVVIKDTKTDLYQAIDSAAHRARHAILRALARRQRNRNFRGRPRLLEIGQQERGALAGEGW